MKVQKSLLVTICASFFLIYSLLPSNSPLLSYHELEESEFQNFISKFQKLYSPSEYSQRFSAFRVDLSYYRIHNSQLKSYTLGINEYSDLSPSEFSNKFFKEMHQKEELRLIEKSISLSYPAEIDWRALGKVTEVKNQGNCSCSWAFASTGVVEGSWSIAGNSLVSLSEQQLLDCSDFFGNNGCNGGYITNSLSYVLRFGLTGEQNYPYTANPSFCNSEKVADRMSTIRIYNHIRQDSPDELLTAVAESPIAVDVDGNSWIGYQSGVVETFCKTTRYNYSALVVGYNTSANPPYYIVKPSFGATYGQAGYIYVGITSGRGACCIQGQPVQAIST